MFMLSVPASVGFTASNGLPALPCTCAEIQFGISRPARGYGGL